MIVSNIMAVSLDGKISSHKNESEKDREKYGFVVESDKKWVISHLKNTDAVILGADSMRAAGKIWAIKNHQNQYPIWVVLTRKGLDPHLEFWHQSMVPRILASPDPLKSSSDLSGKVDHLITGANNAPQYILEHLMAKNCKRVILFGGGEVNQQFYQAGLVNELHLTLAPVIVGNQFGSFFINPGLSHPVGLTLKSSLVEENHVFLSYHVKNRLTESLQGTEQNPLPGK